MIFFQLAGLLYRVNIFNIQSWLRIPSQVSSIFSSICGGMFVDDTPKYRQTYMGATEETHEDILFDYHMKRQQQFVTRMRPGHQVRGYFVDPYQFVMSIHLYEIEKRVIADTYCRKCLKYSFDTRRNLA